MFDHPSYRSFVVRLWHKPGASKSAWRGEVEAIQSGRMVEVSSLQEVLRLLAQSMGQAGAGGSSETARSETARSEAPQQAPPETMREDETGV